MVYRRSNMSGEGRKLPPFGMGNMRLYDALAGHLSFLALRDNRRCARPPLSLFSFLFFLSMNSTPFVSV